MEQAFDPYHLTLIVVALITGVISPIAIQLSKFLFLKLTAKDKNTYSKKVADEEEQINKKLEALLSKYNADRVWIVEFHNGGHSYSGKSLQKFSETYEVAKKSISTEALNTQSLPTSIFVKFFIYLEKEGFYYNDNIASTTDTVGLSIQSFLESRSIKSFCAISIKDINNNFVGILCLDGVHSFLNLTEKNIQDLVYSSASIAGYLESVDNSRDKHK